MAEEGSFVVKSVPPNNTKTPIIVAGGGGGRNYAKLREARNDASGSTNGNGNWFGWVGGSSGNGGQTYEDGGGGGFYSNAFVPTPNPFNYLEYEGGRGFLFGGNGGQPGPGNPDPIIIRGRDRAEGGFGGGGANGGWGAQGGGGGGGYSGGVSTNYINYGVYGYGGGGGGSYAISTIYDFGAINSGHGNVFIKKL